MHHVHVLISLGAVCSVDLQQQISKTCTPLYLALLIRQAVSVRFLHPFCSKRPVPAPILHPVLPDQITHSHLEENEKW
jgi:hypothetical protein